MTTTFEHWWDFGARCWVLKRTRRGGNPPLRHNHDYLSPDEVKALVKELESLLEDEAEADPKLWKRKGSPTGR